MAINPADITTIRVGELPVGTISATSKIAVENGTDLFRISGQDLIDFININSNAFQFEIKDMYVNQAFVDDNFNGTGLGIALMEGWAICNGQNGTPNMDGLVSIGYGTNYPVLNAIGGSKNAVVVEHFHKEFTTDLESGATTDIGATSKVARRMTGSGGQDYRLQPSSTGAEPTVGVSSTEGVSGIDKNMQPYRVLLKIMKL